MASLSVEEENYVRMSLLLTGISPRAARIFFDSEFAPACLDATIKKEYNKLLDLKKKHRINQSQWNLLFPRFPDVPVSKSFDVTLMILLLRNLTPMTPPLCGFDHLPSVTETTPAADLTRIKYHRNYLAHLDESKLDTGFFNTAWNDITCAVDRLGGQQMKQECDHLKTKPVNQTNLEIMMDIKRSNNEIQELKETFESLINSKKKHHAEAKKSHEIYNGDLVNMIKEIKISQEDTVPWHIREAMHKTLEAWRLEDNDFVETTASSNLLTAINQQDTVVKTVVGPRGCGKSFLIKHTAIKMQEDGYDVLPVSGINKITKWFDPTGKQLFVLDIDNACQTPLELGSTLKKWQNQLAALETRIQGTKIIACCSTDIYENPEFQKISGLHQHKFDLKADDNILSDEDRKAIATKYMREDEFDALLKDKKEILKTLDNFPMLCSKFAEEKHGDPTQYFAECIANLTTNDTLVKNENTQVGINVSNSLTNNPVQGVQDMFVNPTFYNCAINFNFNINPINKN